MSMSSRVHLYRKKPGKRRTFGLLHACRGFHQPERGPHCEAGSKHLEIIRINIPVHYVRPKAQKPGENALLPEYSRYLLPFQRILLLFLI